MEAENPLSGLGAAWDAAHASLAAAVDALDPEWVNAAAHKWVDCAIRFVNAVPLDGTTNTGGVGPSEDNAERIWGGGMCRLSVFGVRLGAATQQPGMEARAAECMTRFCRAVHPRIFNAWSDAWEDGGEWGHLFCMGTPLIGAAEPTLRLLLTLLGSYQGWCYRHDEAWDALLGMVWKSWEHNGCNYINNPIVRDTTPRELQRCLLFVAGLCAFKCVDSSWHRLAMHAAETFERSFDGTDDLLSRLTRGKGTETLDNCDEDYLGRLSDDDVRGMLEEMRDARQDMQHVRPHLTHEQIDHLTYLTGQRCVLRAKKAHYRSLWRKWRLLWTCTSRWLTDVGERQGAADGVVGASAIAAYDTDMDQGLSRMVSQ